MRLLQLALFATLGACASSQPPAAPAAEPAPSQPPPAETAPPAETPPPAGGASRPSLSSEQCEAQGGSVVGDIGDGATQRPGYVCPSGKPPTASIAAPAGGPVNIEGAVCCPK